MRTLLMACLLAWLSFAVAHVTVVCARGLIAPDPGAATVQLVQLFSQDVTIGFVTAVLIYVLSRLKVAAGAGWILYAVVSLPVAIWLVQPELDNFGVGLRTLLGALVGLAPVAVGIVGHFLSNFRRGWLVGLTGTAIGVPTTYAIKSGEYAVSHAFALLACGTLLCSTFVGAPLRAMLHRVPRSGSTIFFMILSILAALGGGIPAHPGAAVRHARDPGSVLPGVIARARFPNRIGHPDVARWGLDENWFKPRDATPPIQPSELPRTENPIVLLLTVDALRADLFLDSEHAGRFRELDHHWQRGVRFEQAYSSASSTVPVFASILYGLYFSQLRWEKTAFGAKQKYFLTEDERPTIASLLTADGIRTVNIPSTEGLMAQFAVLKGFGEESGLRRSADELVNEILLRIDGHRSGPMFLAAHFLDPHVPYTRGKGTAFERYLAEVDFVDRELKRLRLELSKRGLMDRIVWILTADHGEAFGEHDSYTHAGTIYRELTHVPLVIRIPGVSGRTVQTPASIIDLGPTILDLFERPTPGHFMGQTLLPLAHGEAVVPNRPIAIDSGRRMHALIFPDGFKVMRDLHRSIEEVYDLGSDPAELYNLVDTLEDAQQRLDAVAAFFRAHEYKGHPGYRTPYRP